MILTDEQSDTETASLYSNRKASFLSQENARKRSSSFTFNQGSDLEQVSFSEIDKISKDSRGNESSFYQSFLYDREKLESLAQEGDQPFMATLSKHHRVMYVKEELNFF